MSGKKPDKATLKQDRFCQLYVSKEFFGNGVESYAEAYDIDISDPKQYRVAASSASRLLKDVNVLARIDELLEEAGLNDSFVDKQLYIAITQNADIGSKVKAIGEYNKVKGRHNIKKTVNKRVERIEIKEVKRDED